MKGDAWYQYNIEFPIIILNLFIRPSQTTPFSRARVGFPLRNDEFLGWKPRAGDDLV